MEDKQALDFNEIDGQLELVIKHLEKKEKKKLVHYYFNESSIERIKRCAQRFHMKEEQFVEEVLVRLMNILETPERAPQDRRKVAESLKRQVTPWGRLAEQIGKMQSMEQAPNTNLPAEDEMAAGPEREADSQIDQKAEAEQEELARLQKALTDYIFHNFKPDYRILYQRFEKQVRENLNISPDVLAKLIASLSKSGEITFYSHQNLLDINKKIFEERMPEEQDDTMLFNDLT